MPPVTDSSVATTRSKTDRKFVRPNNREERDSNSQRADVGSVTDRPKKTQSAKSPQRFMIVNDARWDRFLNDFEMNPVPCVFVDFSALGAEQALAFGTKALLELRRRGISADPIVVGPVDHDEYPDFDALAAEAGLQTSERSAAEFAESNRVYFRSKDRNGTSVRGK